MPATLWGLRRSLARIHPPARPATDCSLSVVDAIGASGRERGVLTRAEQGHPDVKWSTPLVRLGAGPQGSHSVSSQLHRLAWPARCIMIATWL